MVAAADSRQETLQPKATRTFAGKRSEEDVMDKRYVNKHRMSYTGGIDAVEESKWGWETAVKRYGQLRSPNMKPATNVIRGNYDDGIADVWHIFERYGVVYAADL